MYAQRPYYPPRYVAKQAARVVGRYAAATLGGVATRKTFGSQPSSSGAAAPIRGRIQKRTYKKKARGKGAKVKNDISSIKRSIKEMKQHDDATTGTMTKRQLLSSRLLSNINEQASVAIDMNGTGVIEGALTALKFFNPAVPGTLTTASGVSGTFQRNFLFDTMAGKVVVRNNYQSDAHVKIYLCKVKDDTSNDPRTAWSSGVVDGGDATGVDQLNQYPTDYNLLNDLWSLKVVSNTVLSPGQSVSCSHAERNIEYDPSTVDTHSLTYQKEYKAFQFLVVLSGSLSHDVAADDQGFSAAGLDILTYRTLKVKYAAGVNIKYLVMSEALDTPATSFVQSQKPVSDNLAYSIG